MKSLFLKMFGEPENVRLASENKLLREKVARQNDYILKKTNQLLLLMGTLPLRPEDSNDRLLETDPVSVISEALGHILEHKKILADYIRLVEDEFKAVVALTCAGILVLDETMKICRCNQQMADLMNIVATVSDEKDYCSSSYLPADSPLLSVFKKVVETRRPVSAADVTMNGKLVDVTGTAIKNRHGEVVRVLLTVSAVRQ